MAEKRMFTKKITDSDDFIELPASAQALYLHLNMCADDDGFTKQINSSMFKGHAGVDDFKLLLAKRFVLQFEGGVIVIKHWRMHNTLRKDRYVPTNYQEELSLLGVKSNNAYTLDESQMVAKGLPSGCHSIDENSKEEISIGKVSEEKEKGVKNDGRRKADGSFDYDSLTE